MNNRELIWLDRDTGEIEPAYGEFRSMEQIQASAKYRANEKRQKFESDFTWIIFEYGKELFPNLKEKHLTRLIYLSTFCDYNGMLPPKKVLKDKLDLSNKYWSEFMKEMKEREIIIEQDGQIYLSQKFFAKGSLETTHSHTRLFNKFIRDIYEKCDNIKTLNQIAYLYRLIPFVNRRTNMVCSNPNEQDPERVHPITLGEFCDMVGYDKKNARRLAADLLELKCNGQNLIGSFVTNLNQTTWKIIVNPRIYYGGENDNIYKQQLELLMKYNQDDANNTKLLL